MKKYFGLLVATVACAALSCSAFADEALPALPANDNMALELVSIEGDTTSGYVWNVSVENKSDKEALLSAENCVINGLQLYPTNSTLRIAAGETLEFPLSWDASVFEEVGMTGDITSVSFTLDAFETEEYSSYLLEDVVYYPQGEENVVPYVRTAQDTDQEVLAADGVTLTLVDVDTEDSWYKMVMNFYASNETDSRMYITSDNWKINDADCSQYFGVSLEPHTSAYTKVTWSEYMMTDAGVDSLDSVGCDLEILNFDTWDSITTGTFAYALDGSVVAAPAEPAEPTEPAEPVQAIEVDPEGAVRASGAEGKTWADIFGK